MAANVNATKKMNLFKEVGNLFFVILKRKKITENFMEQPHELKRLSIKNNFFFLIANNILENILACMMLAVNYCITGGHPLLGIAFFIVYNGRQIISRCIREYKIRITNKIKYLQMNSESVIGSEVVEKISNKVFMKKADETYFTQVDNEDIVQTIKKSLEITWELQNGFWFDLLNFVTVLVMILINVITNKLIPNQIFIPILIFSCLVFIFSSAYEDFHHRNYAEKRIEARDKKNVIVNDILRVVNITPFDGTIRIQRLKNLSEMEYKNERKKTNDTFLSNSLNTIASMIGSTLLIIFSIMNLKSPISLGTITELTALLAVYNTTISKIGDLFWLLSQKNQLISELEKEEILLKEIIKVYKKETSLSAKQVEQLEFSPFEISYKEQSENDKPFKLILDKSLAIKKGEIVALTGASGSGKSTFMKLATGRITFTQNDDEILTPTNYMFFDETVGFGSLSIWEELFCLDEVIHPTPSIEDLQKMKYIFEKLFLWKEISETSHDVWKWCKEHKFTSLSNGQKQRLVIAKILFWLNDDIDILALDECTSGLDNNGNDNNADAIKILQFIVSWCNRDKSRIILLSTHQNIDCVCNRKLHFERTNGKTIIEEIPINF